MCLHVKCFVYARIVYCYSAHRLHPHIMLTNEPIEVRKTKNKSSDLSIESRRILQSTNQLCFILMHTHTLTKGEHLILYIERHKPHT